MRQTIAAFAAALAAAACSHEFDRPAEARAAEYQAKGDQALAGSRLSEARGHYAQALAFDPQNGHAAFGLALVDLLLLPDAAPVTEWLQSCGQEPLDVEHRIFGPDGVLARDEALRAGSGDLTILYRAGATGSFGDSGFQPDHFRITRRENWGSDNPRVLLVNLTDVALPSTDQPASLWMWLNVDDVYGDDDVVTPLTDGMVIDLARLASNQIYVWLGAGRYSNTGTGAAGTLTWTGGTEVGASVSLQFTNVTLAACAEGAGACVGSMQLSGKIDDVISAPLSLDIAVVPFGDVHASEGPPHREKPIVIIDLCGPSFTADFFLAKVKAMVPILDGIAAKLEVAENELQAQGFIVPRSLLHTDKDIPLNGTDLLALRTALRAASAAAHLVSSYRFLDGPLMSLLGEVNPFWFDNGDGPAARRERTFLASPLVQNLAAHFLTRAAGFDLAHVKARLEQALADAAAALRNRPARPGVLDFQAPNAMLWSNQLADLADSIRASISSSSPVPLAHNPLYKLHLKTFFDNPLDRGRLLALSGLTSLWRLVEGDPESPSAAERNDRAELEWPDSVAEVETWSGGALDLPDDLSGTQCEDASQCPAGYACTDAHCQAPEFQPTDQSAWEMTFASDMPAFVSPNIRLLVDSWR